MKDIECVAFLQWALPRMKMRWPGFRKVRRQVCKRIAKRMHQLSLEDVSAYRNYLERCPQEWNVLDSLCSIPISRFCRHVVFTYFDEPLQLDILEQIVGRLLPAGVLVTGKQEPLPREHPQLTPLRPRSGMYQKTIPRDEPGAGAPRRDNKPNRADVHAGEDPTRESGLAARPSLQQRVTNRRRLTVESDSIPSSHAKHDRQKLARQARAEHDALLEAIDRLGAALASAAPGREQDWNKQVVEKLRTVVDLLDEHARSAEAADGLLAMIGDAQPRLLHRVERLRREHVDLLEQARALKRHVEHHAADELPNFRDIRQRTTWLLDAVRHHRAAAADLIFEAFSTDIGVGD